ncbi:hypothetical protein [Streptomyces sp. B21-101]|uniref:hypothetical protein n=1 Tax=Streptomyces sp. B21-101 TaxID=3039415 RepID=UPI002FF02F36
MAGAPPITVVLPDDQEVTSLLLCRQQTPEGWLYKVSASAWMNTEGQAEPAWFPGGVA